MSCVRTSLRRSPVRYGAVGGPPPFRSRSSSRGGGGASSPRWLATAHGRLSGHACMHAATAVVALARDRPLNEQGPYTPTNHHHSPHRIDRPARDPEYIRIREAPTRSYVCVGLYCRAFNSSRRTSPCASGVTTFRTSVAAAEDATLARSSTRPRTTSAAASPLSAGEDVMMG
jgi:hypothetical protein